MVCKCMNTVNIYTHCTVVWEMQTVKIFSWMSQTKKYVVKFFARKSFPNYSIYIYILNLGCDIWWERCSLCTYVLLLQGCKQVGRAMNLPATAVLCGYVLLGSFMLSPSVVKVPGTDWMKPVIVWMTVSMPTGSRKSTLFRHLYSLVRDMRTMCGLTDNHSPWVFDDASLEKKGALMKENSCRLLGFYDEFSAFSHKLIYTVAVDCLIHTKRHSSFSFTMVILGEETQVSHI